MTDIARPVCVYIDCIYEYGHNTSVFAAAFDAYLAANNTETPRHVQAAAAAPAGITNLSSSFGESCAHQITTAFPTRTRGQAYQADHRGYYTRRSRRSNSTSPRHREERIMDPSSDNVATVVSPPPSSSEVDITKPTESSPIISSSDDSARAPPATVLASPDATPAPSASTSYSTAGEAPTDFPPGEADVIPPSDADAAQPAVEATAEELAESATRVPDAGDVAGTGHGIEPAALEEALVAAGQAVVGDVPGGVKGGDEVEAATATALAIAAQLKAAQAKAEAEGAAASAAADGEIFTLCARPSFRHIHV